MPDLPFGQMWIFQNVGTTQWVVPYTGKYRLSVGGGGGAGYCCTVYVVGQAPYYYQSTAIPGGGGGGGCSVWEESLKEGDKYSIVVGGGGSYITSMVSAGISLGYGQFKQANSGGTSSFGSLVSATGGQGAGIGSTYQSYSTTASGGSGNKGGIFRGGNSSGQGGGGRSRDDASWPYGGGGGAGNSGNGGNGKRYNNTVQDIGRGNASSVSGVAGSRLAGYAKTGADGLSISTTSHSVAFRGVQGGTYVDKIYNGFPGVGSIAGGGGASGHDGGTKYGASGGRGSVVVELIDY